MTTASVSGELSSTTVTMGATRDAARRWPSAGRPGWRAYLPAAAGVAYLVAWVAGLTAWPVNLPLNATAAQTTATYAAHPAEAATQVLLVEGLAGVLLAVVLGCALLSLARGAGSRVGTDPRITSAALLGAAAVAVSLVQCVIGLVLTNAATAHDVTRSGDLSNLLNQLDGGKMFALAGAAACLAAVGGSGSALPRWLRATAVPLGIALVASGYAYLALAQALSWTVFVSGTLLLVWVTGVGIALTVRRRRGARGR